MNVKSFVAVASKLPPEISVLMRGPTGVGKSQLAKQIADDLRLPYIDVRGSVMSEGDVGGYPNIEGMKKRGIMTFCMPSWFVRACREPVVLMLDELNRSLPGVQQSFFQLVLDRELGNDADGNPYRLHPGTRVFAAVNSGAEYDVNEMDPALLRRFWTIDLEPTHEDWIQWANDSGVDPVVVDFIRNNPKHLREDPSKVTPGTVIPCPASWDRLDKSMKHMGLAASKIAGSRPDGLFDLSRGFVGQEAALSFCAYISKYKSVVTAFDVLDGKISKQRQKQIVHSDALTICDRLIDYCDSHELTPEHAARAIEFVTSFSEEVQMYFGSKFIGGKNQKNTVLLSQTDKFSYKIAMMVQKAKALDTKKA